ncbi:hypothetical protein [Kitasatospora sp. NPDC088783]|uniref:hypothetical protein n=1 Tax=Kitasatospora sp. NPDC088783 TaxID=3364077 RepID=UPI0037F75BCD
MRRLMPTIEPAMCEDEATAGPGGAMTVEVGVVTGDLTIRTTRQSGGLVDVQVQYSGAAEWYHLQGSPATVPEGELEDYHHRVLDAIEDGGAAEAPA